MPKIPIQSESSKTVKVKKKGKLLVMPGRQPAMAVLKVLKEHYDLKKPHELIAIMRTGEGEYCIMSNVIGSADKVWMLEHAKLTILSGDEV